MRNLSAIFGFARLAAFAAILLAFGDGAALADGERPWTLQETSGQVRLIKSGISPVALTVGDTFSGGNWIETGPDGRAVVRRGDELILVAPNSRIGLPRDNTGPFATRILQTLGTILLTVEKKTRQHFEVQTPYLTAVVKGTTFTVGIRGQRTVVHVIKGLVDVRDLASGQRRMVRPGQTGVVLSDSGSGVFIDVVPAGAAGNAQDGAAASAAGAKGHAVAVIRDALGPQKINLKSTTGGLMREANGAKKGKKDKKGKTGTVLDKNSGWTHVPLNAVIFSVRTGPFSSKDKDKDKDKTTKKTKKTKDK